MPTPDAQRQLPSRPNLRHLRLQARDLRTAVSNGDAEAAERLRQHVPRLQDADDGDPPITTVTTSEAQLAVAREYGFASWRELKAHVDSLADSGAPFADANDAFTDEQRIRYFAAVRDQDLEELRSCLEEDAALTEARINYQALQLRGSAFEEEIRQPLTDRTATALHQACNSFLEYPTDAPKQTLEVVRILLEFGADPNAICYDGNNEHSAPIVIASWEGGLEKMRLLLDAGADVSGEQGIAALRTAASHDSIDRFDLLQEYGAPVTPWMMVRAGLTDRMLAQVDEDPSLLTEINEDGYTLLQAAGLRMKTDAGSAELPVAGRRMAQALLERGAELDTFTAAALNDVEGLRQLLQDDPSRARERLGDGNTPVHLAVLAGSSDTLAVLLEHGAEPDEEALYRAARMDDTESCRLLLTHGGEVTDRVVLSAAWRNEDPDCLRLFLESGGNPNAVDGRGTLHWVAARNPASVQLLLDAGADPDMRAPSATNNVPLHHAANNAASTTRLLTGGADPTLTNDNGETALDLAARDQAQDVVELLQSGVEAKAKVTGANDAFSRQELVDYFAAFGNRDLDALRACLEANPALTEARVNDKGIRLRGEALEAALAEPLTDRSSTAIHLAANNYLDQPLDEPPKGADAIRLLLQHGADPDAVGYNENTGHSTAIVIAAWIGSARQTDPTKDDPVKLQLLLDAGADATGKYGIAALETAASHDRIRHFDLLVEHGAPSSPWLLVRAGLTDRVLSLVDEDPAWLTRQDAKGNTLLQGAVMRMEFDEGEEQTEGLRMGLALIERGAEVDVFSAAALNDVERLRALLQADPPSVSKRRGDGRTPVFQAALVGSHDTLRLLLESGAEADEEALVRATRCDDTECSRLLLAHGAQVNDRVMLSAAWRNEDPACLKLILDEGGNPNANDGRGTLHWVAAENPASVRLLLDAGADPNMRAPGNLNSTPLHHAANNAENTRFLLAAGADPTLADDNGDTPLDLATQGGAREVAALLRTHIDVTAKVQSANDSFSNEELVAWFEAICALDLDAVRACLDANPALTEARANDKIARLRGQALADALGEPVTDRSSTAIHLAANIMFEPRDANPSKSLELMQLLLERGADVDAIGFNENTDHGSAIVIAAWVGGTAKMRVLLEAGVDVTGDSGQLALQQAGQHGRIDDVDLLLEYGAVASPWMLIQAGLTDRVVAWVDEDPSRLTSRDERGYTLMQAGAETLIHNTKGGIQRSGRFLVEALIERGVEVDVFTAAALDDVERLGRLLREDPTRVNEQLSDGRTPVNFAARVRSRATLELLLQSGADPNRNDPLSGVAGDDDTESCRILIEHGARSTDKAVLAAAWRNKESAVLQLVLDNGGDPDAIGPNGTALHWVAAENSHSVQLLIDAGADVNKRVQETIANTPLHSVGNNVDSAVRLLSAGADPSLLNANGDTPLQRAEQLGHDDVANLLRRHTPAAVAQRRELAPTHEFAIAVGGLELDRVRQLISEDPTLVDADVQGNASIDGTWGYGRDRSPEREDATARAVHFAAYRHPELMQLLIDHGADVDALGYEGNYGWAPPLVLACWEGDAQVVRILLEAGANPNLPAVPGGSALQSAINHYDDDKIQLLLQHGARHDIFSAAAVGDLEEVKRLLEEDSFLLHRQDLRRRRTPLGWAIYHERPHIVDYLLEIGVRPQPHELISLGRLDEIRQAVAEDPEFVHRRDDGYGDGADPPLLWAVQAGHLEVARFLLQAGADPNQLGRWESPLRLAYDDVKMARLLIDAGADINGSVFPGWTILASTVHRRGYDVAELLLERGADIDGLGGDAGPRKGWGLTPLQTVVRQCSDPSSVEDAIHMMTFLLDRGADINAMSRDGQTALDLELAKKGDVRFENAAGLEAFLREHGGKTAEELKA